MITYSMADSNQPPTNLTILSILEISAESSKACVMLTTDQLLCQFKLSECGFMRTKEFLEIV